MKKRTPILLLLLILVPLLLLGWFGVRDQQRQQALLQLQLQRLINAELGQIEQQLQAHFRQLEARLIPAAEALEVRTQGRYPAASVRELVKQSPELEQLFVLSAEGARLFPPRGEPLPRAEQRFVEQSAKLLESNELFAPAVPDTAARSTVAVSDDDYLAAAELASLPRPQGWIVWYAATGPQHLFWWQDSRGATLGFVLNAARLTADLIAQLPASTLADDAQSVAELVLLDNRGAPVYAWGDYRHAVDESPRLQRTLDHPMGSWRLAYYAPRLSSGAADWLGLTTLLVLLGAGLSTLAYLLYREHNRSLRLAEQRVNFVNQVSHELKTPLTNVRLYAELLENELPQAEVAEEESSRAQRYLGVISSESQRLSRLIENVLSYARLGRGALKLCPQPGQPDARIAQILQNFAPALAERELSVAFEPGIAETCRFDGEALEQILNNLINNCEKYAVSGGRIELASWQQGACCFVRVRDFGPGIAVEEAERIFTPFYRISHRLSDGVTGTGIGLGLARDLARAHGGDLVLEPARADQPGASFLLTLHCPPFEESVR